MDRRLFACVVVGLVLPTRLPVSQTPPLPSMPYTAVHDPQFVSAADAAFMNDEDRVIGLMSGKIAKAYSAGILSQHGLVEDRSPKGPIAITW